MLKVSDETLFSGQAATCWCLVGTPRDPPRDPQRATCEQVSQTKSEEGHLLIACYPEGGRLWRFMINCMDKISSVSNEG